MLSVSAFLHRCYAHVLKMPFSPPLYNYSLGGGGWSKEMPSILPIHLSVLQDFT
jgi:hypothetical protein